jgi:para-nitrobenzyl esterase
MRAHADLAAPAPVVLAAGLATATATARRESRGLPGGSGDMTDAAVVRTDAGPVRGTVTDTYRLFQGIPYAASTAGEGRWHPPGPVWRGRSPIDATRPGSMCPQQPSSYADVASLEEDCLCLNVTTPRSADSQQHKPVMVWIHGDGAVGAGSIFDARRLATRGDVVVVTINYRLGIFGAFGHPGLDGSGTFGLQDQQGALRWVARNAAAFGGDPGNVTVFGESYGGSPPAPTWSRPGRRACSTGPSSRAASR